MLAIPCYLQNQVLLDADCLSITQKIGPSARRNQGHQRFSEVKNSITL